MSHEKKVLKPHSNVNNSVRWAIDAGTSRSGACFTLPTHPDSFFSGIPSKEQIVKIPTDILIDRQARKLVAFGEEAIQRYHEGGQVGDDKYVLFEKFKMQLYRENKLLKERPTVKSVCGTVEISVVDAFGYVFQYFRQCAEEILAESAKTYHMNDIDWLITVPAIWSDGAKQLMVEAAKKGGLTGDDSKIIMCLEPTAASLWAFHTLGAADPKLVAPGTKCLTVDAGGGTIDIMLFEVLENQEIKKLAPESGGGWGSTFIDKDFERMLDDVFGQGPMDDFRKFHPNDYHEMMNDFESVKVRLSPDDAKDPTKTFGITGAELSEYLEAKHKIIVADQVKERGAAYGLAIVRKKLKIPVATMMQWFKRQITYILEHLKQILNSHKDVKYVYMVGGFSNSDVLFGAVKSEFEESKKHGELQVVRPPHPGEAIVAGATLFGRTKHIIRNIIKDVSYGIETESIFDPNKHNPMYRYINSIGEERAHNCFNLYLRKGQSYEPGHSLTKIFYPGFPKQTEVPILVFISESENPIHTTEPGCQQLGIVELPIPIPKNMRHSSDEELMSRRVTAQLVFEGERLRVIAAYPLTGESRTVDFDFFTL